MQVNLDSVITYVPILSYKNTSLSHNSNRLAVQYKRAAGDNIGDSGSRFTGLLFTLWSCTNKTGFSFVYRYVMHHINNRNIGANLNIRYSHQLQQSLAFVVVLRCHFDQSFLKLFNILWLLWQHTEEPQTQQFHTQWVTWHSVVVMLHQQNTPHTCSICYALILTQI